MKKVLLILMVFFCAYSPSLFAHDKKILIINSYHRGFQWSDDVIAGMEEIFYNHPEITTNIWYMDSKRVNSEEYYAKLRELYKMQLQNQSYDLIVAVDKFAYDFVVKYYHELFTTEPILFTGIEQFNPEDIEKKGLDDRFYGILEKRAISDIIPMISKMMPSLKNSTSSTMPVRTVMTVNRLYAKPCAITTINLSSNTSVNPHSKSLKSVFPNPTKMKRSFLSAFTMTSMATSIKTVKLLT